MYLNKHIGTEERGVLVAWNGASCDLEWIYRLTQSPSAKLSLSPRVQYFLDPYHSINKTTSCGFNKKKSKLDLLCLGNVYEFMSGEAMENAHCSLADAKAQTEIVLSKEFRTVW